MAAFGMDIKAAIILLCPKTRTEWWLNETITYLLKLTILLVKNLFYKFRKWWNIVSFNSPKIFIIDSKIFVYNTVTETNYPTPLYLRMFSFEIIGNSIGSLSDNLKFLTTASIVLSSCIKSSKDISSV